MIKFWFHKYLLYPQTSLSAIASELPREGALFKMQWPDKKVGYADLFPWPELGDPLVDAHINELERGHISKLLEQTIWLARKDAVLRSQNKNALTDMQKVKNHYLVNDFSKMTDSRFAEVKSAGFTTLKVKVGRDWQAEIGWINKVLKQHSLTLRLDFNSKGSFSILERMMTLLASGLKQKIEFVEDPFPYDYEAWMEASRIFPLAVDHEYENIPWKELPEKVPFRVLVIKPARQDVDLAVRHAIQHGLKIVVTSALDHPVGVVHAIRIAAELKAKHTTMVLDSGCFTHRSYLMNEYSTKMTFQGPYLTQVPGSGIGFDRVLEGTPWRQVDIRIR